MKKFIFIVVFILLPILLWAQNSRTIIPVDSELYRLVDNLCYESGMAEAESARPWSAAEFEAVLERIDYEKLSKAGRKAHDYIIQEISPKKVVLEEENLSFDISLTLNPEAYAHVELEDSEDMTDADYIWTHGYEERKSFLSMPLEFWYADSLYLILKAEMKEEYLTVDGTDDPATTSNYFNVIFDDPSIRIDTYFPFRAVSSAGGDWWDVYLGRDDLSWGNGKSGNLVISDYSDFYDFLMFKLWSESITWTSVYMLMENSMPDDTASLISHRLDFSFFDNRLRFSVMESGALVESGWEMIRDLNFLMVYHNWNTQGKVNSMMALELAVNPWKYFNIYGQLAMDEFVTSYEDDRDGGLGPSVFSYIAGASGAVPINEGYLNLIFEWAITSPFMYTKGEPPYYYNTRTYWSFVTDSMVEIRKPTGYVYGPDAIVYYLEAEYSVLEKFSAGMNMTWLTKGETELGGNWGGEGSTENSTTPTGIPEYTYIMNLNGEYEIFPFLSCGADLYLINVNNYGNVTGAVRNDLEFAANITFELSAESFKYF